MCFCTLYLCGLCECILCAFGDGAKVSAIEYSKTGDRRNNQQHKACKTGGDVELEEEGGKKKKQQLMEIKGKKERKDRRGRRGRRHKREFTRGPYPGIISIHFLECS